MRKRYVSCFLCAALALVALIGQNARVHADSTQTYVVLYQGNSSSPNVPATIAQAGGTVVYNYSQIGVVIASSADAAFGNNLLAKDSNVSGVVATAGFGTAVETGTGTGDAPVVPGTPAPGDDDLSGLQWDMVQIHAPEARAITGGSPSVVVGVVDTGIDYTHPDLASNIDFGKSVSCAGGVPNSDPAAWNDDFGHGTHVAGTIAAAKNGIGIVGVAPNSRLAAIKASVGGFFFPEAVVCAFVWAGTHHIQVINNSYFVDPWLFNCRNDPAQRAIWEAVRRAVRFAMQNGAVVVAALGNESDDLAHPTQDSSSPDNTSPVVRDINNACAVIPAEIPGVIGVTANGNKQLKSFYSNYGSGVTQVIAPGGDSILQVTAAAPNGRVLSTFPAALAANCARKVFDNAALYCYMQGTSMAAPHVSGEAALIVSTGVTSPSAVAARINNTADPIPCPSDLSIYSPFPSLDNGAPQVCQGGAGSNSFNGHGQVNVLKAMTK